MHIVHIFDAEGQPLAKIKTSTPGRTARTWLRDNDVPEAHWYAARAA